MSKEQEISLIVLSHGLWGVKSHMGYIEKQLNEKYGDAVHILNATVNEAKYTYDGIDICGERLADEVEATVVRLGKNGKRVKKVSMIGYSLGGLIVRFAIGLLGQRGFFNTIEPDYFITFATPHMGCKKPSKSITSTIFNFVNGRLVSRSGEQLQLVDTFDKVNNKTILEVMSDPDQDYFKYLAKFKVRRTYANIANDRTVPYWTSGMELMDYFNDSKGKIDLTLDEKYFSIVTGYDVKEPGKKQKTNKSKENRPLKPKLIQLAFYCLFPIFPLWMIFALTMITSQGLMSRYRVSKILSKKQKVHGSGSSQETLNHRRASEGERYVNGELLAGVLDAINLPGENKPSVQRTSSQHTVHNNGNSGSSSDESTEVENSQKKVNDEDYFYKVLPSKSVEKSAQPLPFDERVQQIQKNLKLLEWERAWVYLRVFNAHGSIICRQKVYRNDGGEATIQHFLDTTQFS